MTDIRNTTVRRVVLVVFLVPALVASALITIGEAVVKLAQELPGAIREVWRDRETPAPAPSAKEGRT